MKDEYVLFLDESETKSSIFTISGIALKKSSFLTLETACQEIKSLVWNKEFIKQYHPVLHCTELETVFRERTNNLKHHKPVSYPYEVLRLKSAEEIEKLHTQIYARLSEILRKNDITVFSCVIRMNQLQQLYFLDTTHNGHHLIDDKYNIALQNVIENYTHFLNFVDGYGDIIYESRNALGENSHKSPDVKLINNFHQIHANNRGIVYTSNDTIQSRNRTITTLSKNSHNAGLELADFVAYNIPKIINCKVDSQMTDFMKQVHRAAYNGGHSIQEIDQRAFWGIRVLPSYLEVQSLKDENRTLRNSYQNLKKELD